jgi:hypothetical protein
MLSVIYFPEPNGYSEKILLSPTPKVALLPIFETNDKREAA